MPLNYLRTESDRYDNRSWFAWPDFNSDSDSEEDQHRKAPASWYQERVRESRHRPSRPDDPWVRPRTEPWEHPEPAEDRARASSSSVPLGVVPPKARAAPPPPPPANPASRAEPGTGAKPAPPPAKPAAGRTTSKVPPGSGTDVGSGIRVPQTRSKYEGKSSPPKPPPEPKPMPRPKQAEPGPNQPEPGPNQPEPGPNQPEPGPKRWVKKNKITKAPPPGYGPIPAPPEEPPADTPGPSTVPWPYLMFRCNRQLILCFSSCAVLLAGAQSRRGCHAQSTGPIRPLVLPFIQVFRV